MTVKEDQALGRADYWDGRYADGRGHEWFRTFKDLEPFFYENLVGAKQSTPQADPLILHLGSGDSAVPAELACLGYTHQLCVDFSSVVVDMMTRRHSEISGIEWKWADVRNLEMLADESVDVALDKGTLDAMVYGSGWNPPDEVKVNTGRYMREVHRVLKDDGMFLYITFRQGQFIRPLLNPEGRLWDMTMQVLQTEEGTFPYYGYVIQKKTALHSEDALPVDAEGAARASIEPEEAQLEPGTTVRSQSSGDSSPVDPENFGALFS